MRIKIHEKEAAVRLRISGKSIAEIASKLQLSKSTVSIWLRDIELSNKAKRLIQKRSETGRKKGAQLNHARLVSNLLHAKNEAQQKLEETALKVTHLQLLCALAYWCEGEKTRNDSYLVFTNSDPQLVATFLYLLRNSFPITNEKFRICLHLHHYHNEKDKIKFWSRITKISESQFIKVFSKKSAGIRKHKDYAGCASVRYYDAEIARDVLALGRQLLKNMGL